MRLIFTTLLVLYLVGNAYILYRGLQTLRFGSKAVKIIFALLYVALVFFCWKIFRGEKGNHTFYVIGSGAPLFTLYMVMWLLVTDIVFLIGRWSRWKLLADLRLRARLRTITYWGGFALVICLLGIGHYRYKHPATEVINIVINKPLKGSQQELKVIAISDVHLGYDTNKQMLRRYVEQINALRPDLILIGGDLIDHNITPVIKQHMEEELNRLQAPLGIYMVPGNHDYYSGINNVRSFLQKTPIRYLADETVQLPNGLVIAGRDDYSQQRQPLSQLLKNTSKQAPVLLLDHQPRNLNETVKAGVDLQFSGHTHNGQVWPFPLLVRRLFDLAYGLRRTDDTYQYVSSGLSLWGPPYRIGTQSEIVVFNLQFTK